MNGYMRKVAGDVYAKDEAIHWPASCKLLVIGNSEGLVCLHLQVLRVLTIPHVGFTLKDDCSETCQEVYKESIWDGCALRAHFFLISCVLRQTLAYYDRSMSSLALWHKVFQLRSETSSTRFFLPKNALPHRRAEVFYCSAQGNVWINVRSSRYR